MTASFAGYSLLPKKSLERRQQAVFIESYHIVVIIIHVGRQGVSLESSVLTVGHFSNILRKMPCCLNLNSYSLIRILGACEPPPLYLFPGGGGGFRPDVCCAICTLVLDCGDRFL